MLSLWTFQIILFMYTAQKFINSEHILLQSLVGPSTLGIVHQFYKHHVCKSDALTKKWYLIIK